MASELTQIRERLASAPEREYIPRGDPRYVAARKLLDAFDGVKLSNLSDDDAVYGLVPHGLRTELDKMSDKLIDAVHKLLCVDGIRRRYAEIVRPWHERQGRVLPVERWAYLFVEEPLAAVCNVAFPDEEPLSREEQLDYLWLYGCGSLSRSYEMTKQPGD